jgi:hypothetical protein
VRLLLVLAALVAASAVVAQDRPAPPGTPAAQEPASSRAAEEPSPEEPEEIDVDTAIVKVVERLLAVPRFEEEIEVRDPYQEALDAHLEAAELECRAPQPSSPGPDELNRYGANPRPPSVDLVGPARLLFGKAKEKEARFFLYSVRREDAPQRVVYVVLDGRVSAGAPYAVTGTTWDLVAEYSERSEARDALERLERGNPAAPDEEEETARTLWAATGCE